MLKINNRIVHFHQVNKLWHWRIKDESGTVIKKSEVGFETIDHCERDVRSAINA